MKNQIYIRSVFIKSIACIEKTIDKNNFFLCPTKRRGREEKTFEANWRIPLILLAQPEGKEAN